ncbi:thiol-disulfide oxidoreductase DCC family protein [Halobacteriales archaeon Cl-PHB]
MAETNPGDHPILLFDGVCNLCTWSVRFVVERDPNGIFRFAPLQSDVASELLANHDQAPEDLDSVVLLADGEVYTKSDAAIRVATRLGGVYRLLGPFRYVPRVLRDAVYDLVAASRYRIFGKRDSCLVPTDDLASRFLSDGAPDSAAMSSSQER